MPDAPAYGYLIVVRPTMDGPRTDALIDVSQMLGHDADSYKPYRKAAEAMGARVPDEDQIASFLSSWGIRSRYSPDSKLIYIKGDTCLDMSMVDKLLEGWNRRGILREMLKLYSWD